MSKFYFKNPATKQNETAYIAYMMIASFFKRAECVNAGMEKQLYLYYKEMPVDKQIRLEERVLHAAEQILRPYKKMFSEMKCTVGFNREADICIVSFHTGFETVNVSVNTGGRFAIVVNANVCQNNAAA